MRPPRRAILAGGVVALALALSAGCRPAPPRPVPAADAGVAVAAVVAPRPASAPASVPASAPGSAPAAHHHGHPPIDCPLAKAGVDAHHLRPFADVARYIAHLERQDRAAWQKPDAVVTALGLKGTETVADVGAGSGYFSFRLARALPRGQVLALDVEPEMVRHVHHRARQEGVENLRAVLIKPDDPGLQPGVDVAFVCDVLHHVPERAKWVGKLAGQLKPGARLVVIEFKEGDLPQGPPAAMKIPRADVIKLVGGAGFVLEREEATLLPYQRLFVFRRK